MTPANANVSCLRLEEIDRGAALCSPKGIAHSTILDVGSQLSTNNNKNDDLLMSERSNNNYAAWVSPVSDPKKMMTKATNNPPAMIAYSRAMSRTGTYSSSTGRVEKTL